MKFVDIPNIWTVDLALLSNSDRGRVYFERAKQVVVDTFCDPEKLSKAVNRVRFRRTYLIEQIGCGPAVPQQNPNIRSLLADADSRLRQNAGEGAPKRQALRTSSAVAPDMQATIDTLRKRLADVEGENCDLRRKLEDVGRRKEPSNHRHFSGDAK